MVSPTVVPQGWPTVHPGTLPSSRVRTVLEVVVAAVDVVDGGGGEEVVEVAGVMVLGGGAARKRLIVNGTAIAAAASGTATNRMRRLLPRWRAGIRWTARREAHRSAQGAPRTR
jgi:hypothetical protein